MFYTKKYLLECFQDGDIFSASADKRRFTTIDNNLFRIAEIINDGVISGWNISQTSQLQITVTSGDGFIDKFYINTFDDKIIDLNPNSLTSIYVQRKQGIIGIFGPRSNLSSISYTDDGSPSSPSHFTSSCLNSFVILLQWSSNIERDLKGYVIKRSTDNISFNIISNLDSSQNVYEDIVDEDQNYYYELYAVDLSGNLSIPGITNIRTPLSNTIPPDPINILTPISEGSINILWEKPNTISINKISNYILSYVELNSDGSTDQSSEINVIVDKLLLFSRIDGLIIGQPYKITLYTVDIKNRISSGVSFNSIPQFSPAPRDPENITYTMQESSGGVQVNLSWVSGDTPYDSSISYRYKVYTTISGSSESLPIDVSIGETKEQVSLYTFNLRNYFPIPENSIVTFRITSLDNRGFESFGNYVRFTTSVFKSPQPVRNLITSFDEDTAKIIIRWSNQSGTDKVFLEIIDSESDDPYNIQIIIVSNFIGMADLYILENVSLNHLYTIRVIPYNNDGNHGPITSTSQTTIIPGGLSLPEPPNRIISKTGDKQITLSWEQSSSVYAKTYTIYKKIGNTSVVFNEWIILDILSYTSTTFTDYGLQNDETYSYYITTTDIYGRESLHLVDGNYNLNYIEVIPRSQGLLTAPDNLSLTLMPDNSVIINWSSLLEEFNSFAVYRSINNLHSWQLISTVSRDTFTYTDITLPLINNTVFYYLIGKSINDGEIIANSSSKPLSSILIGKITTNNSNVTNINLSQRRIIKDLLDPLNDLSNIYILPHKHRNILTIDPDRIDLNPELIVDDWQTVDGRIFTTTQDIIGTSFIIKVNNKIPSVFFTVDTLFKSLIFSEPIVQIDPYTGELSDIPAIEVRVLGIEEVQNTLEENRFNNIHAQQIKISSFAKEQLPELNHEGRIKEKLIPKSFLLERYNDYTFTVPQDNSDSDKNFGDGTNWYSFIEHDGEIENVLNFDLYEDGLTVGFQKPDYDLLTANNINNTNNISEVDSKTGGFQSNKSCHIKFNFVDNTETRWLKLTTNNTDIKPNPIIKLDKKISFRILSKISSFYLTLGIREIDAIPNLVVGDNGGTNGSVEWVGIEKFISINDQTAPQGVLISPSDDWQEIEFDLRKSKIQSFDNGNSYLSKGFGVLEHLAITINQSGSNPELIDIYIDAIREISDLIVAGTSQGIQLSDDFGITWNLSRYTDSPVSKFFRAKNNPYLWAITSNQVLLATDPESWYVAQGTVGIQNIHDIIEDSFGNMFISTDKGVYWIDISLINTFGRFQQTSVIDSFSSDSYGLYLNQISSGLDEIWASTVSGIYITTDGGFTWNISELTTSGLVAYRFIEIQSNIVIAFNSKEILRKNYGNNFIVVSDLERQYGVNLIWDVIYFSQKIYVSTDMGMFVSNSSDLINSTSISFVKVFEKINNNSITTIVFGMGAVNSGSGDITLLLGTENLLFSSNKDNLVVIKKDIRNKELPVFFVNNENLIIGYTYNSFNNVLVFREPRETDDIVSCSYLPILKYVAINGGWAQTRPEAELFIYKNGIPTWLDWNLDNIDILSELQLINGNLSQMTDLNTFNSLYPQSETQRQLCLSDILTIKQGGDNNSNLINDLTITTFIQNYTKFVSLVTKRYYITKNIQFPKIILSGISRESRKIDSRANLIEQKENFQSESSVGVKIDTISGIIDFSLAFANAASLPEKEKFRFKKTDILWINIFNTNIKNTGIFTHREIEDQLEQYNTGLSSDLSTITATNIIKAGIYLESQNHFLFDIYKTSNIQSKFYSSHTNSWYDIINSTIDYKLLLKSEFESQANFITCFLVFQDDPYFEAKIWAGTDKCITEYALSSGTIYINNTIKPDNTFSYIKDIYRNNNIIYCVSENIETKKDKIFYTNDFGDFWFNLTTIGLPDNINTIRVLGGNLIASTSEGIFYSDNDFETWYKSDITNSDFVGDPEQSTLSFNKSIINVNQTTFLIVESEKYFYTSNQGIEFLGVGQLSSDINAINKIERFKNITYLATNSGIYRDGNSILSNSVQFGSDITLDEDLETSLSVSINDITHSSDALYCCGSNGKIYRFFDSGSGNVWTRFKITDLETIHKIAFLSSNSKHYLLVSSFNKVKLIDITSGSGVFDA